MARILHFFQLTQLQVWIASSSQKFNNSLYRAIDYYPSRGAKNRDADSWVPMDASFKQYEFSKGLDVTAISGIDVNQTLSSYIASGEINESLGWATGFDPQIINDTMTQAQENISTYIQEHNDTITTAYDVIGGKKIIEKVFPSLPSSLPNQKLFVGARYDKLPSSLQQKMSLQLSGTSQDDILDEFYNGPHVVVLPMAKLNNEKLTLSFKLATQADEDALAALIPEGNITDPSQLPQSLPLTINVKPQIKLNGNVIMELPAASLGSQYQLTQILQQPNGRQITFSGSRAITAGGYYSINAIAQSVSAAKLRVLQEKLSATQSILQDANVTELATLTREEVLGDMMYAGTLSYYAQYLMQSTLTQQAMGVDGVLLGGSGVFGYKPEVVKLYGLPIRLASGGISLDIVDIDTSEAKDFDPVKRKQAAIQTGMIGSALEHSVPEQMFNTDPNNYTEAFSSMKAMQKANEQGQKIFQITKENVDTVMPQLQLAAAAKADIEVAARAGYTVITHEKRITLDGYTGEGYIILDEYGYGSYLINGGLNGAFFSLFGGIGGYQATVFSIVADLGKYLAQHWSQHPDLLIKGIMSILGKAIFVVGWAKAMVDLYKACSGSSKAAMLIIMAIVSIIMMASLVFTGFGILMAFLMNIFSSWMSTYFISQAQSGQICRFQKQGIVQYA